MAEAGEAALQAWFDLTRRGDAQAAKKFYTALLPLLRRNASYVLSRYGRADMAEDAVQDALLAIHTKMHTYQEGAPVLPWVYAILRYKAVDLLRRKNVARVSLDDCEEIVGVKRQDADVEAAYDLNKLLDTLDPVSRDLVTAVKMHGASVAELAARSGYSEANVKVIVHRSMRRLAQIAKGGEKNWGGAL